MSVPGPDERPPARRGVRGSALDMLRSMAVVLAMIAVVLVLAPQPEEVRQPPLDDATAVGAWQQAAGELDLTPLLVVGGQERALPAPGGEQPSPVVLGEGWQLDYARTQEIAEVPTWRMGLLSPDDRRVDVEQTLEETPQWLVRSEDPVDGDDVVPAEPLDVAGTGWERLARADGRTAYVHRGADATGRTVTTAVSANDDAPYLVAVVEAVGPVLEGT